MRQQHVRLDAEYGTSGLDQRHRFVGNWVSRLPWEFVFSGIVSTGAGRALNPTTGGIDVNGDAQTGGDRPLCGVDPRFLVGCTSLGIASGDRVPRNAFLSNSTLKVDLRLSRVFRLRTVTIDPSLEVFNLFNRQNYDPARSTGACRVRRSARRAAPTCCRICRVRCSWVCASRSEVFGWCRVAGPAEAGHYVQGPLVRQARGTVSEVGT